MDTLEIWQVLSVDSSAVLYQMSKLCSNRLTMELAGMVRHEILFLLLILFWVTVSVLDFYSGEEFSEDDHTQSDNDDLDFESWMSRQSELKENVRKVCDKYGKSLNGEVPLNQFMFDSKHNLLYCRNAKVKIVLKGI